MHAKILDPPIISMDDFVEWYQREPFEYDNGEYIRIMSPQITRSGRSGFHIARLFADFVEENNLGEVFSEVPFVLVWESEQWVKGSRTPDVMFYNAERMQAILADPEWEDKPMIGAPDFVIEIISPTDQYAKIMSKIAGYLRDGVRLVWLVDPKERTVTVCTPNNHYILIHDLDATLETTDIIPGFKITVRGLLNL
jgi:Uma2 family endonuclease